MPSLKIAKVSVPTTTLVDTPTVPKAHKAKLKTGVDKIATDGLDPSLALHTVRRTAPITPEAGIQSSFPLHDLGLLATEGRYGQGFRLDSGSLRGMHMQVRRTKEADGTAGFEIFFQAQGGAIDRYAERFKAAEATTSMMQFSGGAPDPDAPAGKAQLVRDGKKWSPSGSSLLLESPGKWQAEIVPGAPETIKGAMRIRVLGSDAEATAALGEVINKLGLQSAFAPADPKALERYKLLRLLWQVAPGSADVLKLKRPGDLAATKKLHTEAVAADPGAAKAIAEAKLGDPAIAERVKLANLLYRASPKAFLAWASSNSDSTNGILPAPSATDPSSALKAALTSAGVTDFNAGKVDPSSARALLELGVMATKDPARAGALIARDIETVNIDQIHDLCAEKGISDERIANLRFDEVYPGYFTVVDPSLSKELHDAGARYLYSTADNPDRVHQILTGGQKASLTRFQEGILIEGMSSDTDFGTGGGSSVFTRLVTESAIAKAKANPGAYGSDFNDWAGARPYKMIINRTLLDRTDWYGHTSDVCGKSTGLTEQNHGATLVKAINDNYRDSNELCFAIGNDTAFIDYVTCKTQQQKTELITKLTAEGITEWHGRPLESFIIITPRLMEHPDDVTLSAAISEAIAASALANATAAAQPILEAKIAEVVTATLPEKADTLVIEQQQKLLDKATSQLRYEAEAKAKEAVAAVGAPTFDVTVELLAPIAQAAAAEATKARLASLDQYDTYSLDYAVKPAYATLQATSDKAATDVIAKLTAEIGAPTDATPETRQAIKTKLEAAICAAVSSALKADVEAAAPKAQSSAEDAVAIRGSLLAYAVRKAVLAAAQNAAVQLVPEGLLAARVAAVEDIIRAAIAPASQLLIEQSGPAWVASWLKTDLEPAAIQLGTSAVEPDTKAILLKEGQAEADAIALATKTSFATSNPTKVTPADEAMIGEVVTAALGELAQKTAAKLVPAAVTAALDPILKQSAAGFIEKLGSEIADQASLAAARTAAKAEVYAPLTLLAANVVNDTAAASIVATVAEMKGEIAAKLMAQTVLRVVEQLGNQWGGTAISTHLQAALDAIMAKAT